MRALRPSFLDDLRRPSEAGRRPCPMTGDIARHLGYILDDDIDDIDESGEDDFEEDDDEDKDEDEDPDEDVETWQVLGMSAVPLKVRVWLTSGFELPRLTSICQLC
jgi:hypothetical protein